VVDRQIKPLPGIPGAKIVAEACLQRGIEDAENDSYDLHLTITGRKPEMTAHFARKLSNGGGVRFTDMKIDTARYEVAPGLRAFGIRAGWSMSFASSDLLSLFIVQGSEIREILSDAAMRIYFTNRGSPCMRKNRQAERIIVIDKRRNHGFFDLLVKETLDDWDEEADAQGNCDDTPVHRQQRVYRLQFDGKQYNIPAEMANFDCRLC